MPLFRQIIGDAGEKRSTFFAAFITDLYGCLRISTERALSKIKCRKEIFTGFKKSGVLFCGYVARGCLIVEFWGFGMLHAFV
jgi:hypothetical protein